MGANLLLEVADDGCRTPPQDRERMFERFYHVAHAHSGGTDGPADACGTGLGLAIVRHPVAAMNESVTLQSEPGKSTKATLRIPQFAPV